MHDGDERRTITLLLDRAREGDADASAEVWQSMFAEIHRIARGFAGREGATPTIQASMLVSEAYLRLFGGANTGCLRSPARCVDVCGFDAHACHIRQQLLLVPRRCERAHAERRGAYPVHERADDVGRPPGIDVIDSAGC